MECCLPAANHHQSGSVSFSVIEYFQYTDADFQSTNYHDDALRWKRSSHYWPFVQGIRTAMKILLLLAWAGFWTTWRIAGDMRSLTLMWRHCIWFTIHRLIFLQMAWPHMIEYKLIAWCFNTLKPIQYIHHFADGIFQRISWTKMYELRLKFHWSFLRAQITTSQHWKWKWLGADQATSHYLNQWWLVYWRIYASLGLNGPKQNAPHLGVDIFKRISMREKFCIWFKSNSSLFQY